MGKPTKTKHGYKPLETLEHGLDSERIGQVTLQYVSSNNVALQRGCAMLRVLLPACFCQLVFSLKTAALLSETCVTWVAVTFSFMPGAGKSSKQIHCQKFAHLDGFIVFNLDFLFFLSLSFSPLSVTLCQLRVASVVSKKVFTNVYPRLNRAMFASLHPLATVPFQSTKTKWLPDFMCRTLLVIFYSPVLRLYGRI